MHPAIHSRYELHYLSHCPANAIAPAQGQQVSQFQDHTLLRPDSHVSNVYINQRQDLIVSWCKVSS